MYELLHSVDLSVFGVLHDLAGQNAWADSIIVFFGHILPYLVLAVVVVSVILALNSGKKSSAIVYAAAVASGLVARYGVAELIRYFYHRPRPFAALNLPHLLTETSYSFPSGHAIFFFALAAGVFSTNKRFGAWLYVAAILIGLGRIAAGVHYPSDILGGAILGVVIGHFGARLFRKN